MLDAKNIHYAYHSEHAALQDVSLSIQSGTFFGILGPNGAGKTTLLKILSGFLPPLKGSLEYQKNSLQALSLKERSTLMAYVAQSEEVFLPYTVRQIVLMGRAPYLGLMGFENKRDHDIVDEAMRVTEIKNFENRFIQELSGGEQQRVFLARALSQQTPILLLDEPTSHLDLHHQLHFFQLLKKLQQEKNLTIIATLHDLNLAALFADQCLFLKNGKSVAIGDPQTLFQSELLSSIYDCRLWVERDHNSRPYVRPLI